MTALSALLGAPFATTLAWTLLHFVWQGAVLAAGLLVVLRFVRLSAGGRYAAGVATLALMLSAPIATFIVLFETAQPGAPMTAAPPLSSGIAEGVAVDVAALRDADAASRGDVSISAIVVALWGAGVLVLATRLLGGWYLARRLVRRDAMPVAADIESMAIRMAGRLALDRVVRIAQSSAVAVPVMVGWLKPVVLFPASVLAGLSPTQIEALLAHELAHVRRHDYLVNLLQSILETMLFYHPAVWWVSRRVRIEREHCCDDVALSVCDRLVYATALSDLAALAAPPRVALAATDGSLLQRVRRILGGPEPAHDSGSGWLPLLSIVAVAAVLIPLVMASTQAADLPDEPAQVVEARTSASAGDPQTGVQGGVSGGVGGGVAAGVPGGVVGGVPQGTGGGVSGGVLYAIAADVQTEQERAAFAKKVAELQREAESRLRAIEEARQQLEQERVQTRFHAEIVALQAQMKALADDRARMKDMVAVGTLTPTELAKTERELIALQQRIEAIQTERNLAMRELELRAEEVRRMRELQEAIGERDRLQRSEALQAALEESVRDKLARQNLIARSAPLGDQEKILSGDLLVIEIQGEPDVPRAYTVAADGTIRLPLSAPLRVLGLTAPEVAQQIVRQLSERGLERPAVDVMLRRPRGSAR